MARSLSMGSWRTVGRLQLSGIWPAPPLCSWRFPTR